VLRSVIVFDVTVSCKYAVSGRSWSRREASITDSTRTGSKRSLFGRTTGDRGDVALRCATYQRRRSMRHAANTLRTAPLTASSWPCATDPAQNGRRLSLAAYQRPHHPGCPLCG